MPVGPQREPLTMLQRIEGHVGRLFSRVPGPLLLRLFGEQPHVVDGRTLDPHVQVVLKVQKRKRKYGMCEPSVEAGRRRYRREVQGAAPPPTVVGAVRELRMRSAAGDLEARHYAPPGVHTQPLPTLVFFHGGGFVIGDLDTHDEPCRLLCRDVGLHVVSVAYGLAPEHPFPAAVDDCCAAMHWVMDHVAEFGGDASRVCVGGDSAGANLAAVAALQLAREGRPLSAQLLLYPTTDARTKFPSRQRFASGYLLETRDMDAFQNLYFGADTKCDADPRASPLRATDLALSPPTLVVTAGFDPLRDEGRAFADALRAADVTVQHIDFESLIHGFLHFTAVAPTAQLAMRELCLAFRAVTPRPEVA